MQQFTSIRLSNLLDALQSFGFSPKIPFVASNSSPSTFRGKEVRLFLLFLNRVGRGRGPRPGTGRDPGHFCSGQGSGAGSKFGPGMAPSC